MLAPVLAMALAEASEKEDNILGPSLAPSWMLDSAKRRVLAEDEADGAAPPSRRARPAGPATGENAPGHSKQGQNGGLPLQLLKVVAGLAIATSRDVRDIGGAIFRTCLVDAGHQLSKAWLATGKEYYETVKQKPKEHGR